MKATTFRSKDSFIAELFFSRIFFHILKFKYVV